MRLHCLQHVPFEDAANIGKWAAARGWIVTTTCLYANETLPAVSDIDWLAIMGGLMNIYEHEPYPWLITEKAWIAEVINADKPVIGVCLGAQLIADVLGGEVIRNAHTEIGWFPVTRTEIGQSNSLLRALPETFEAFHWHGDTFELPPGAKHLAFSEACKNQAFQFGDRVLGLQYHLDYHQASLQAMVEHCSGELGKGAFIQRDQGLLTDGVRAAELERRLHAVLDRMATVNR